MCPTRWTVRAEALTSIAENYVLQMTWEAAKDAVRDTDVRARIGGVAAQMERFDFYFGVELGRKLLNIVDNLSRTLQATAISACEGQKIISLTVATLQSIRSDEIFDMFWEYIENHFHDGERYQNDMRLEKVHQSIQKQLKITIEGFTLKQLTLLHRLLVTDLIKKDSTCYRN